MNGKISRKVIRVPNCGRVEILIDHQDRTVWVGYGLGQSVIDEIAPIVRRAAHVPTYYRVRTSAHAHRAHESVADAVSALRGKAHFRKARKSHRAPKREPLNPSRFTKRKGHKPKFLWHCTQNVTPGADGLVRLTPGTTNVYGVGIYFGKDEPVTNYGDVRYRVGYRDAMKMGVSFDANGYYKSMNALELRVIHKITNGGHTIYHCKVVRILDTAQTERASEFVFGGDTRRNLTRKAWDYIAASGGVKIARPPHIGWRLAGILMGLFCLLVFRRNQSRKWWALGRFLLGFGGEYRPSADLVSQWNSGVVNDLGDGKIFIRPNAHQQLFWIVGGMHLEKKDGLLYGEDVYDFHPQRGQNTIRGEIKSLVWAFSGGNDDPTRVPRHIRFTVKRREIHLDVWRLAPRVLKREDLLRLDGEYVKFSNNVWNFLGGVPFKTVLEINSPRVSGEYGD